MAGKAGSLMAILGAPKDSGAMTDDEDGTMADDFESAAVDAFPELADQPDRLAAFKQAIMACMNSDYDT